jgi:cytochrome c oxidase cbb3-type subunit I/II
MYWAGWTQSLMWKEFTPEGTLAWGNFLDTVTQIIPDVRHARLWWNLVLVGYYYRRLQPCGKRQLRGIS